MYTRMTKRVGGKEMCWRLGIGLERNDGLDGAYDVYATRLE